MIFKRKDIVCTPQPYEVPSTEVLYVKTMQSVLVVSGGEFDEEDDDVFGN